MTAASGINQDNVISLLRCYSDGIFRNIGCILSIPLFVEFNLSTFSGRKVFQVANVHSQLLNGARSKGVPSDDQDFVLILQEEEADL
jgi:hypothetical protein